MLAHPAIEWLIVYWWVLSKNSVVDFEIMRYQFLLELHFFIKLVNQGQHDILKIWNQIHYWVSGHFQTYVNFLQELIFEINFIMIKRAFHIPHG